MLGIDTYPMNWPIGSGKEFKGVYDRNKKEILAFQHSGKAGPAGRPKSIEVQLGDPGLDETADEAAARHSQRGHRAVGRRGL